MVSRVQVLSIIHVRPAETSNPLLDKDNDEAHTDTIKLSFFDTRLIPLQPMQRLFFYEGDDLPPFPALLATLQSSLATTLAVFTPLAGHVAVSKPPGEDVVIDCSAEVVSQGVRFVEAEYAGSTNDMRRLASDAEHDVEAYAQLVPAFDVGALPVPALAVQVTRPADTDEDDRGGIVGAVVVGVSMNHAVADGRALWEFIRAWAAAARDGSPVALPGTTTTLPPVFDRALINSHPKAQAASRKFMRIYAPALPRVKPFPRPDTAQQRRRTYLLSASQILSLKQRISLQSKRAAADGGIGGDNNAVLPATTTAKPLTTTYVAVASLVWTSCVRAKNAPSRHAEDDDACYLAFPADCRARLRPPMPAAFFGNCVKMCYARATVGELRDREDALACAAAAVREAIQEQLEEQQDPLGDVDQWLERYGALPRDRLVQMVSSHRFAAYETDFGWGRPSRVELASEFVRELVALVGAPDGAVQVSVALDRGCIEGFEANFLAQVHGSE